MLVVEPRHSGATTGPLDAYCHSCRDPDRACSIERVVESMSMAACLSAMSADRAAAAEARRLASEAWAARVDCSRTT
eukprot:scaffold297_cov108-Isochrysis_galbana.AAC.24